MFADANIQEKKYVEQYHMWQWKHAAYIRNTEQFMQFEIVTTSTTSPS